MSLSKLLNISLDKNSKLIDAGAGKGFFLLDLKFILSRRSISVLTYLHMQLIIALIT